MSKANDCWGIEVGANALKAVRLTRKKQGIVLTDFDVLPFKKVLTTPDLNVAEAIQVNLDQFMSRHSLRNSTVVVSVPGHAAFARFAKLPPVEPKRIPDIVRFEAVQQIPFPIDQVEWDYQVFSQPDSPDVEVGIFAITKDRVNELLENYRAVGLTVDGLSLSPLAVYNALTHELDMADSSEGVIFMDIGTSSTDVIIAESGRLWLRTLPIGGNNFTDALVRSFKLSFAKAEKLKREAGTSKYARQIFQAMRPVFADLVQEMQRSLGYYQSLNREATLNKLVGVGSTFRLPGMTKFLKQQLQLEVVRPDDLKAVTVESKQAAEVAEHAPNLMTAYGLALQGLGLATVDANILPRQILEQRLWRGKQVWFGAAAALMVAATGAAGVSLMMEQQEYKAEFVKVDPQVRQAISEADAYIANWNNVATGQDPRQKITNLRRILDYREVWPKLMLDIDQALTALRQQPGLPAGPYEQVRAVPRNQRRRVYIQKIEAAYRFTWDTGAVETSGHSPQTIEDIWSDAALEQMQDEMGMDGDPGARAMPGMPLGPGVAGTKPEFVITVVGTTPYVEAARFLDEHFLRWLRNNAERRDRPYRVVANSPAIVSVEPPGSWTPGEGERGREMVLQPAPPPSLRQPVGGGRPGGWGGSQFRRGVGGTGPGSGWSTGRADAEFDDPDAGLDSGYSRAPQTAGGGSLYALPLVPPHPLSDEARAQDWRFTITWTVQLIRPEEARRAEDDEAGPDKPAPPEGGAAAAAMADRKEQRP